MSDHLPYLLLVSGDLSTLQALSLALTMDGIAVSIATTWSEVMSELQCLSLSVILYDLIELDNEERRRLKVLRRTRPDLPIVLLPCLESPELSRAVEEGLITAYLVKPAPLGLLRECVHRLSAERQTVER